MLTLSGEADLSDLILPKPAPTGEIDSLIDITLDSEILKIEKVVEALARKQGQRVFLQSFEQEILGRFEEIGFRVSVAWYEAEVNGVANVNVPRITILERLEGEFDPDQMVYEVTKDILDLGTEGVIKTDGPLGDIHKH